MDVWQKARRSCTLRNLPFVLTLKVATVSGAPNRRDPSTGRTHSTSECRSRYADCLREYFDTNDLFHCLWRCILQDEGLL
ncbi:hypothetical protein, partial [Thermodesulfitimonas sp.]